MRYALRAALDALRSTFCAPCASLLALRATSCATLCAPLFAPRCVLRCALRFSLFALRATVCTTLFLYAARYPVRIALRAALHTMRSSHFALRCALRYVLYTTGSALRLATLHLPERHLPSFGFSLGGGNELSTSDDLLKENRPSEQVLYALRSAPYPFRSTLCAVRAAVYVLRCTHSALRSALYALRSTFCAQRAPLYATRFTLCVITTCPTVFSPGPLRAVGRGPAAAGVAVGGRYR